MFTIFLLISDCIPYSIEACKKAAKINDLEIGSDRFPFLGEDYSEVGCYSYKTGNSKGHVFYGTGGTDAQMRKEATGRRYRPRGYDCGGKSLTDEEGGPGGSRMFDEHFCKCSCAECKLGQVNFLRS